MAIKTVLSGDYTHLNEIDETTGKAKNNSLSKLLKIYRGDKEIPTGVFELTYKVNDKIWGVGMKLDFLNEKIEFNYTDPETGFHNKHSIDPTVENFFKKEFINLIFFDPQRVKHIFMKNSAYNPRACIEKFCGIDTISKVQEEIKIFEKNKITEFKNNSLTTSVSANVEQTSQALELVSNNLKKSEQELKDHKAAKENIDLLIEDLDNSYKDLLDKHKESKKTVDLYNKEIKQNNSDLQELQNQILENIISRPYDLSNEYSKKIKDLMSVFDKHQIPEKDSIALFEQILENKVCICGNHIGEKEKQNINEYRKDIAENNEMITFLNSLKDFWKNTIKPSSNYNFTESFDNLKYEFKR